MAGYSWMQVEASVWYSPWWCIKSYYLGCMWNVNEDGLHIMVVNKRQRCKLHMLGKRGGRKIAVRQTRASNLQIYSWPLILKGKNGSMAVDSDMWFSCWRVDCNLEVTGSGPVYCDYSPPPLYPTIIMKFTTLSFVCYYTLTSILEVPYERGIKMCWACVSSVTGCGNL